MARQTKITIETDIVLVLKGKATIHAWCERCGTDAEMISLETTAVISNVGGSGLGEWLDSQQVHRSQAADGVQLICVNSLVGLGRPWRSL